MSQDTRAALGGRVKRGLAWSMVNNLSLRMVGIGVTAVVARILTPAQFGAFFVAMTVQVILGTLAEFGLGADLIRRPDAERRAPTVATLSIALSAVLALVMVSLANPIGAAFRSPEAVPSIRLMSVSILISGLSVVPAALLQRDIQQSKMFAADATGVVVSAVLTIVLAALGLGALSLAVARVVSQTCTTGLQFVFVRRWPRFGFEAGIVGSIFAFGGPLALANFVSWVLLSVDNLVVARATDAVILGLYVIAFNLSSWPMSAIGQAVRVVALPAFSRSQPGDEKSSLVPAVSLTWTGGLLIGLLMSALATPMVLLLFGQQWAPAAQALVGLALFGALRVVFDLVATFLIARGATRQVMAVQLVWLATLAPALAIGVARWGLAGAGYSHLLVAGVFALPCYLMALRSVGVPVAVVLKALAPPLLPAALAAGAAYGVSQLMSVPVLSIAAGGIVGTAVYAALLWTRVRAQLRSMSESPRSPESPTEFAAPPGGSAPPGELWDVLPDRPSISLQKEPS